MKLEDSPILRDFYSDMTHQESEFVVNLLDHGPREEEMMPRGCDHLRRSGIVKVDDGSCFLTDAGRLLARFIKSKQTTKS